MQSTFLERKKMILVISGNKHLQTDPTKVSYAAPEIQPRRAQPSTIPPELGILAFKIVQREE